MNRRALTLTDQSRSDQRAAQAGGLDPYSTPPASNCTTQIVSVREAANHFDVDQVTIRRWIRSGCPCVRHGRRGPACEGLLDLHQVEQWLLRRGGQTVIPAKSIDEAITMERIAEVLMKTLSEDSAHVCAGEKVTRAEAAAVLLRAWQRFCETFGKTYRFDEQLEPIRTLMSEL